MFVEIEYLDLEDDLVKFAKFQILLSQLPCDESYTLNHGSPTLECEKKVQTGKTLEEDLNVCHVNNSEKHLMSDSERDLGLKPNHNHACMCDNQLSIMWNMWLQSHHVWRAWSGS